MRRVSKSNHRGSVASVAAVSHEPSIANIKSPQIVGDSKPMLNIANLPGPTMERLGSRIEQRCTGTDDLRCANNINRRKISDASSCPSSMVSDRTTNSRANHQSSSTKERPHRAHCQRFNQGNSHHPHENPSASHSRQHARHYSRSTTKHGLASESCSSKSSASTSGACSRLSCSEDGDASSSSSTNDDHLPYPGFPEVALKYLTQDARPRNWCLLLITNPYPF